MSPTPSNNTQAGGALAVKVRKSAADNCMQVKLSIRNKAFRVKDEESARKIEADLSMEEGTVNATKGMTPAKKAESNLKTLTSLKSQAESIYYAYTLDSGQKGIRLLNFAKVIKPAVVTFDKKVGPHGETVYAAVFPRLVYKEPAETIAQFEARIGEKSETLYWMLNNAMKDACVLYQDEFKNFMDNHYDSIVQWAQAQGLYNPKDYPPKAELARMFGFEWSKAPITQHQVKEFESLHGMSDCVEYFDEVNRKQSEVIRKQSNAILMSLVKPLSSLLKSLKAKENKDSYPLYDSLITNLLQGVASVRATCNDPNLERFCSNIEATIGAHDIEDLKNDSAKREDAMAEALTIEEEIEEYVKDIDSTGVAF